MAGCEAERVSDRSLRPWARPYLNGADLGLGTRIRFLAVLGRWAVHSHSFQVPCGARSASSRPGSLFIKVFANPNKITRSQLLTICTSCDDVQIVLELIR